MSEPRLIDARRQVLIGGARNAQDTALCVAGATSVLYDHDGKREGVYIDDTTPFGPAGGPDGVAHKMVQTIPGELIVVGLAPAPEKGKSRHIAGCITALEWFAGWILPPKHEGYILWWDYVPPGEHPVSHVKRAQMLVTLSRRNPKILWVY